MKRLKPDEIVFLLTTLDLPNRLRTALEQARDGSGLISDDEADMLRDLCGDRLQTHGFGPDYEPTPEGVALERMIDRLFIG